MTPARTAPHVHPCDDFTAEDFARLRSLTDRHDDILALLRASERRSWMVQTLKTWGLFLAAIYAIATSSLHDIITRWGGK